MVLLILLNTVNLMIFALAALTTKENARSNAAYIIRTKTFNP
jgi:hypothetical protein